MVARIMNRSCSTAIIGLLLWQAAGLAQTPASPPAFKMDADECAVWQRELSFAQSVESHDAKAFASHLHPGTVFNAGTSAPVRGKDAVLANWASLIEGKVLHLRWHPDVVNIGGDRNIAISRGPYMIEDSRPAAKEKYQVGTFMTIWTRQPGGEWVVLFDGGGPPSTPVADLHAAEKFMSQASAICPAR